MKKLINKDTYVPDLNYKGYDSKILDQEIKSLEHIQEMLIKYFDDRVAKCTKCIDTSKTLRLSETGIRIGKHFTISLFMYKSKLIGCEICVGEYQGGYVMQERVASTRGMTACKIVGWGNIDILKTGDNLRKWFEDMADRYNKKSYGHDINLLVTFGFTK